MTDRLFVVIALFLAWPAFCLGADRPNVIFLMADDLGYGDVGFNGNDLVKTPNLDRMAAAGLRFTRFYSVGPMCSPTRACVQTGRHCMRFGMIGVNLGKLPKGEINLPQIAKSKGYTTGHFGKWHLGTLTKDPERAGPAPATCVERYAPPWQRHYDTTFATVTNVATWDPLDDTGLRSKHRCHFWSNGIEENDVGSGSAEKIIMDRAIDFASKAVAAAQPFLATIWFYGPHSPTRAGKELRDLYPGQPLGHQHYLGSITSIDNEVGRLRASLQQLGVEKNTLIFFCADNGPEGTGTPKPEYNPYDGAHYGSAGGFRGRKRHLYNGGVCVPAFAYWPDGIAGQRTIDASVCTLDYLPTLAALLGYEMPDSRPLDGVNILPVFKAGAWKRDRFIPFASGRKKTFPTASVISGEHKLLLWFDRNREDELYHLASDPEEKRNLVGQRPDVAATLKKELMGWLESARHSYAKGDYPGYERQDRFISTTP